MTITEKIRYTDNRFINKVIIENDGFVTTLAVLGSDLLKVNNKHHMSFGTNTLNSTTSGYSVAFGELNTVAGRSAFSSGSYCEANGHYSMTQGNAAKTSNEASNGVALNQGTIVNAQSQTAIGTYNIEDITTSTVHPSGNNHYKQYAFIIGNGTNINNRSNAMTVAWNGNMWNAGNLNSDGNLTISGTTNLNNSLTVSGATNLNSSLTVSGATNLKNSLTVSGDTNLNSKLTVSGDIGNYGNISTNTLDAFNIRARETVTANKLNVIGAGLNSNEFALTTKSINVTGTATIEGRTNLTNETVITATGVSQTALTVNGSTNIIGKTVIGGDLVVTGNISGSTGTNPTNDWDIKSSSNGVTTTQNASIAKILDNNVSQKNITTNIYTEVDTNKASTYIRTYDYTTTAPVQQVQNFIEMSAYKDGRILTDIHANLGVYGDLGIVSNDNDPRRNLNIWRGDLTVSNGNATINGTINAENIIVSDTLQANNNLIANDYFEAVGESYLAGPATIGSGTSSETVLNIVGKTDCNGDVAISGMLNPGSQVFFHDQLHFNWNSLPHSTDDDFFVSGITAFANGGILKYKNRDEFRDWLNLKSLFTVLWDNSHSNITGKNTAAWTKNSNYDITVTLNKAQSQGRFPIAITGLEISDRAGVLQGFDINGYSDDATSWTIYTHWKAMKDKAVDTVTVTVQMLWLRYPTT